MPHLHEAQLFAAGRYPHGTYVCDDLFLNTTAERAHLEAHG